MTSPFCNWNGQYKQAVRSTRCAYRVQEAGFQQEHRVTLQVCKMFLANFALTPLLYCTAKKRRPLQMDQYPNIS